MALGMNGMTDPLLAPSWGENPKWSSHTASKAIMLGGNGKFLRSASASALLKSVENNEIGKVHKQVLVAKDFFNKTALEVRLSERMQSLLSDSPRKQQELQQISASAMGLDLAFYQPNPASSMDDELAFARYTRNEPSKLRRKLENALLQAENTETWDVPLKAPAIVHPFGTYYQANIRVLSAHAVSDIYGRFNFKLERPSGLEDARPFQEYYHEHMKTLGEKAMVEVYRRFRCKPSASTEGTATYAPAVGSTSVTPFGHLPSVGTWAVRRCVPKTLVVSQFVEDVVPHSTTFQRLPSVGSWLLPSSARAIVTPDQDPSAIMELPRPFHHMSSVGTWLTQRVATKSLVKTRVEKAEIFALERPEHVAASAFPFSHLPSVGTWMAPRLLTQSYTSPDEQGADGAAPTLNSSSAAHHLPSVGTWLNLRCVAHHMPTAPEQSEASKEVAIPELFSAPVAFVKLASVGTWLAPLCGPQRVTACVEDVCLDDSTQNILIAKASNATFWRLPSVGAWLAKPRVPQNLALGVRAPTVSFEESPYEVVPAPAPAQFHQLPSVGTWFARPHTPQNFEFSECVSSPATASTDYGSDLAFEEGFDFEGDDEVEIDVDDVHGDVCIVLDDAAADFLRVEIL